MGAGEPAEPSQHVGNHAMPPPPPKKRVCPCAAGGATPTSFIACWVVPMHPDLLGRSVIHLGTYFPGVGIGACLAQRGVAHAACNAMASKRPCLAKPLSELAVIGHLWFRAGAARTHRLARGISHTTLGMPTTCHTPGVSPPTHTGPHAARGGARGRCGGMHATFWRIPRRQQATAHPADTAQREALKRML